MKREKPEVVRMVIPVALFQKIQGTCRYHGSAYDENREIVEVCRAPRRTETGEIRAACSESVCPLCSCKETSKSIESFMEGVRNGFRSEGAAEDDGAETSEHSGSDET